MFEKYLLLINKLTKNHIEAIEKYAMYGQALPVGNINNSWTIKELLWNDNLVSETALKDAQNTAQTKFDTVKEEDSKYDLEDEVSNTEVKKDVYLNFTVPNMGIKVCFTWEDASNALYAIIMIRKYHIAQKVNEAKFAKTEAELKAKIATFSEKVSEKDPAKALKEAQEALAKLKL